MNRLRNLDAYPKINEDFYKRTLSGGVITFFSSVVMLILFFSELRLYMHPVTETQLRVDTSRGEKLRINFDVTFPALQCSIISIDTMDVSGERHLDVVIFEEQHVEFLHFLTNVCAIVGGIFTVSGIVDSFIYHGQRAIKKKMEIGKFN
ncbi:hypothetical protein DY000_02023723 [Brassica cretica]|uniref:Endoplasmic reticulum vesicle transporter N-terminal domain-containing protein n=1 Tax=Brassica cretica TaxID=69181 RepID=A0ABQ7EL70_BRACR|nr:hypothetical protein DY000_02023723 [Brassica cretica]